MSSSSLTLDIIVIGIIAIIFHLLYYVWNVNGYI